MKIDGYSVCWTLKKVFEDVDNASIPDKFILVRKMVIVCKLVIAGMRVRMLKKQSPSDVTMTRAYTLTPLTL